MGYREISVENLPFIVADVDKRLAKVELLKPEVMAYELSELRKDVAAMKRAFYTFGFGAVLASLIFALSVFALLGPHH